MATNDVTIRISAKNLTKQAFQEAVRDIGGVGRSSKKASQGIAGLNLSFGSLVAGFAGGLGAIQLVRGAWRGLTNLWSESIKLAAEQERVITSLNTALIAQGLFTPGLSKQYQDLAASLQKVSTFGDEAIIAQQSLLVQIGDVGPEQMERALQAVLDLSVGLGRDLQASALLVGKAFAGETGELKRYGIVIDQAKLKTEGASAVLDAIQEKFGGQALAEIETYQGRIKQLGNTWGDLKEVLGATVTTNGLVTDGLRLLTDEITEFQERLAISIELNKSIIGALQGEADAITTLRDHYELYSDSQLVTLQLEEQLLEATANAPRVYDRLARSLRPVTDALTDQAAIEKQLAIEHEQGVIRIKELARAEEEQAKILKRLLAEEEKLLKVKATKLGFDELLLGTGRKLNQEIFETVPLLRTSSLEYDDFGKAIGDATVRVLNLADGLEVVGKQLGEPAPVTFIESLSSSLRENFEDLDLGGLIVGAFQGGGDVGRTIGGALGNRIGSSLGTAVSGVIGGTLGKALGSFLGPLGAIAGGILGDKIGKLFSFGPSQAELEGREVAGSFRDSVIAEFTDGQIQEAFNAGWDDPAAAKFLIGLRDAFDEYGVSAAEAERLTNKLWQAERQGPEAVQAVIAEINALTGGLFDLADIATARFGDMEAAANRYGIELDSLGSDFLQHELDIAAKQIIEDFELLKSGGADVDAVLTGMSDEISDLVQDSLKFGTEIPKNMRPLIEQLLASGELIDENGEKLTSLEGLTFAQTLTAGLKEMTAELQEIAELLRIRLPEAIEAIPDFDLGVRLRVDDRELLDILNASGGVQVQGFAGGTDFRDFGRGSLAVLHDQEAVVPRRSTPNLAAEIASELGPLLGGSAAGSGETHIHLHLDGREIERFVVDKTSHALDEGRIAVPQDAIVARRS